nr:hypothetical protein Itr_chr14CG25010 [Ipomoea trifida]
MAFFKSSSLDSNFFRGQAAQHPRTHKELASTYQRMRKDALLKFPALPRKSASCRRSPFSFASSAASAKLPDSSSNNNSSSRQSRGFKNLRLWSNDLKALTNFIIDFLSLCSKKSDAQLSRNSCSIPSISIPLS